ncbi:hypothetical protein PV327_007239 [Microctonus hyperodae]|uniref:Uncharacterized protein n=1 Tax=Microctonus hyperodae TaxID=165561 RepID=A0AA39KJ94_MICHY|nr:hypothetical protein PV327_007239 [Microctonus hyperodae]
MMERMNLVEIGTRMQGTSLLLQSDMQEVLDNDDSDDDDDDDDDDEEENKDEKFGIFKYWYNETGQLFRMRFSTEVLVLFLLHVL